MSLIVGWNKGGVGTSTLHKILKDAGVFIDEHKSGSAYQKGYKVRLLPVCSDNDSKAVKFRFSKKAIKT